LIATIGPGVPITKETSVKHSEFRALETNSSTDRIDAVLTGAVTAFCSLTRPLRQDVAQLEDLALPLLACASQRAKRHAAAALSEHRSAPKALAISLAQEPIAISAPLLLRSPVLTEADLIALVHRGGLDHARAIARRKNHSPDLARLLESLGDPTVLRALSRNARQPVASHDETEPGSGRLGEVRSALREIMRGTAEDRPDPGHGGAGLIREALNDNGPLFQTALADALGISFQRAGEIIGNKPGAEFLSALKALALPVAEAYFTIGLIYGVGEASREDLKSFACSYTAIDPEAARATVRRWKAQEISERLRHHRSARRV